MDNLIEEIQQVIEQRSQEWYRIRLGRFTASEIWKLLTEPQGKSNMQKYLEAKASLRDKEAFYNGIKKKEAESAKKKAEKIEHLKTEIAELEKVKNEVKISDTARTYILDKVAETLTGVARDFTNDATVWGIENERLARKWYHKITGNHADEAYFIEYGKDAGGSSDGKVNQDGLIEIKCPWVTTNHLQHCLADTQEKFKEMFHEHYTQIQANLLFSDRQWCDFISFDPRIQSDIAYYKLRIESDTTHQQLIRSKVEQAIHQKELYLKQFAEYKLDRIISDEDDLPV